MVRKTSYTVQWIEIYMYLVNSIICQLNNRSLVSGLDQGRKKPTLRLRTYVQASAAKWTLYFPTSPCTQSLMSWTEYHKCPEGMSPLNLYKLKNLHVCSSSLANKI